MQCKTSEVKGERRQRGSSWEFLGGLARVQQVPILRAQAFEMTERRGLRVIRSM